MMKLCQGTPEQKAMAQDALNRWWWPSLMMFGPPDADSVHSAQSAAWKIKILSNDELRQRFVDQTVPQADYLGITMPDPTAQVERGARSLRLRPDRLRRTLRRACKGNGPCNRERLRTRVEAWENGAWVREAALAHADKQARAPRQEGGMMTGARSFAREQRMAALGSLHPQPARPRAQARRQPACGGRRDGDQERARRLHPAQRRREHLGGDARRTSPPARRATRSRCSSRPTARCTAIRPSFRCRTRSSTFDIRPSRAPPMTPITTSRLPAATRRQRSHPGAASGRVVRAWPGARGRHRADQRRRSTCSARRACGSPTRAKSRPASRRAGAARTSSRSFATLAISATCCWSSSPTATTRDTMARQFYFDAWHELQLDVLSRSTDARIAEIAAKGVKEVRYHVERSSDWVIRLGDGTDESHAAHAGRDATTCGCTPARCSSRTRPEARWRRRASAATRRRSRRRGASASTRCWTEATLTVPASSMDADAAASAACTPSTCRHLLAEMQVAAARLSGSAVVSASDPRSRATAAADARRGASAGTRHPARESGPARRHSRSGDSRDLDRRARHRARCRVRRADARRHRDADLLGLPGDRGDRRRHRRRRCAKRGYDRPSRPQRSSRRRGPPTGSRRRRRERLRVYGIAPPASACGTQRVDDVSGLRRRAPQRAIACPRCGSRAPRELSRVRLDAVQGAVPLRRLPASRSTTSSRI